MSEKKHTILIVDDERDVLDAVRRSIYSREYKFVTTTDPHEALDILGNERVDVIISDVDMPEMSGHELMVAARRLTPSSVRILLTGRGTMDSAIAGINEGEVYRFVTKPFEPAELKALVKEAIERAGELALMAEASLTLDRKNLLMQQLEQEHPGIAKFDRDEEGCYLLDVKGARGNAEPIGLLPFF